MKLGIVGFGHMGGRLADASCEAGLEIVSILDHSNEPFGLGGRGELSHLITSEAEAFWRTGPEIVAVATHAPTHIPLLREGLMHGIRRFLIEKPVATSMDEAREGQRLAHSSRARVIVNHNRRYCDSYDKLRKLNGATELGDLRAILFSLGGGGLGCLGTHYFDMCNMLFEDTPISVTATLTEPLSANPRGSEFHDPGAAVFARYRDGRRAYLDIGDDYGLPHRIEFIYSHGRVLAERELAEDWKIWARTIADRDMPMTRRPALIEIGSIPPHSMPATNIAALADCAADTVPKGGIETAIHALEFFAAARWSDSTRAPVALPLIGEAAAERYAIP